MEEKAASMDAGESAAKKRKPGTPGNSLTGIKLEVLQFEIQKLNEHAEKLEAEKHHYMDECVQQETKILKMEETLTKLQEENEKNKNDATTQISSLNSIINEKEEKIRSLEDENAELQTNIEEMKGDIVLMREIKSELAETAENDCDKLKAEIQELKNKNQKLLDDHKEDIAKWKNEKETAKKTIKNLENQLLSSRKLGHKKRRISKNKLTAFKKSAVDAVVKRPKIIEKAPILSAKEQAAADDKNNASHLPKGARVFGIWGKEYYAAIVDGASDGLGRIKVFYTEDQAIRNVPYKGGIIPLHLIKEESDVSVVGEMDEDGEKIVYDGKVLAIPDINDSDKWQRGIYKIEIWNDEHPEREAREIVWSDIYFTEKQYKKMMSATTFVQEDILVDRRQKRSFVTSSAAASSSTTSSPAKPPAKPQPLSTSTTTPTPSSSAISPMFLQAQNRPAPKPHTPSSDSDSSIYAEDSDNS